MGAPRIALVLLPVVSLVGCAEQALRSEDNPDARRPVTVTVADESVEQRVLGEIYVRALEMEGRPAEVRFAHTGDGDEGGDVELLTTRTADVVVTCTGDALARINPSAARELSAQIDQNDSGKRTSPEVEDLVAEALVNSLPSELGTTDRSTAVACEHSESARELPQNIIPVYKKTLFNRDELKILNDATKILTSDELQRTVEEAEESGNVSAAVEGWISSVKLTGNGDSASSDPKDEDSGLS